MKSYTLSLNFSVVIFLVSMFVQVNAQQSKRTKTLKISPQSLPKISFVSGKNSLKIPFELSNNLILIQTRVNESEPLWFILDTGAESTVIDLQLAKDLQLKSKGKIVGNGTAGSSEASVFKSVSLSLPNVKSVNQTIYGLPIDSFSASFGQKISGVIGNDIIKKFVVEVDYASKSINLYEPESFRYSGSGEIVLFTIEENLLFVRASIALEGRSAINGKFELDSGSTGAILLNAPFVKKNRLLKSVSKTKQIKVGGVGGTGKTLLGRIENVKIGSFALENLVARFYQDTGGDNASAKYDGLIGGEVFRRFKVIFDISRRKMILEPNALASEPFEIDMSGLELVADGADFSTVLVDDVEVGSSAAQGGIEGDDIITEIDGRSAKEFTLEQIRKLFMQSGKDYLISIKRGEQIIQTKLVLRRTI